MSLEIKKKPSQYSQAYLVVESLGILLLFNDCEDYNNMSMLATASNLMCTCVCFLFFCVYLVLPFPALRYPVCELYI